MDRLVRHDTPRGAPPANVIDVEFWPVGGGSGDALPPPLAVLVDARVPVGRWPAIRRALLDFGVASPPRVCGRGAEAWSAVEGASLDGFGSPAAALASAALRLASGATARTGACAVVTADPGGSAALRSLRGARIRTMALIPASPGTRVPELEREADWFGYLPLECGGSSPAPRADGAARDADSWMAALDDALSLAAGPGAWVDASHALDVMRCRSPGRALAPWTPEAVVRMASLCPGFEVDGLRLRRRRIALSA